MNESRSNSIRHLCDLYGVVIAIAIGLGFHTFLDQPGFNRENMNWKILIAFLLTIIPFSHGAVRHLFVTYVERGAPDIINRYLILVDYYLLFLGGGLFVALSSSINNVNFFLVIFIFILSADVVWGLLAAIQLRIALRRAASARAALLKAALVKAATAMAAKVMTALATAAMGKAAPEEAAAEKAAAAKATTELAAAERAAVIPRNAEINWAIINLVAVLVLFIIWLLAPNLRGGDGLPEDDLQTLILFVAGPRTFIDYVLNLKFYFP